MSKSKLGAIILSVVVHLILLFTLLVSFGEEQLSTPKPKPVAALQSYLVFNNAETVKSDSPSSEPQENVIADVIGDVITTPDVKNQKEILETLPHQPAEISKDVIVEKEPQSIVSSEPTPENTPSQPEVSTLPKTTAPTLSSKKLTGVGALNAAKDFLNRSHAESVEQLVQQEAQQTLEQLANPIIQTGTTSNLTADEEFRKSFTQQVNCDKTINKVIAIVSTIAQGTLKCSDKANLDPYLKKHQKKPLNQ